MYNTVWQVCDSELFPVSIFEVDSVEHQPIDPQKDEEIEALQGINVTERYTTYCIYQELSSCNTSDWVSFQLPCRILYCLHFASIVITIIMVKSIVTWFETVIIMNLTYQTYFYNLV